MRTQPGGCRDVLLLGASAGGVAALRELVSALPADLPACVLVVLHLPRSGGSSTLPQILARECALPVDVARTGDALTPGRVLVAPVERHLLVRDGRVVLSSGPLENGQRPAVDPLFRSAAQELGPRVVAAVLTGNLDDGSAGLRAVARHGGVAVVQDPGDASFPGMPTNALEAVPDATVAPLRELPKVLTDLVRGAAGPAVQLSPELRRQEEQEVRSTMGLRMGVGRDSHPGTPTGFSCPDCGGVLFGVQDTPVLRYRCRVGHGWSAEALSLRQEQAVESALWMALRALEERAAMATDVASAAARAGRGWSERHFRERAWAALRHADVLRGLLVEDPGVPEPSPNDVPGSERVLEPAGLAELPEPLRVDPVLPESAGSG